MVYFFRKAALQTAFGMTFFTNIFWSI